MKKPFMWRLGAKLFQWLWDSKRYYMELKRGQAYKLAMMDEIYERRKI